MHQNRQNFHFADGTEETEGRMSAYSDNDYVAAYSSYKKKVVAGVSAAIVLVVAAAVFAFNWFNPETREYENVTTNYIASHAAKLDSSINIDTLEPADQYLHVKYTLAFNDKVDEGETIESMYSSVESTMDKLISQVDGTTSLYTAEGLDDAYIAFTDSTRINGLNGRVLDSVFAWDDLDGNVVDGITYDSDSGIVIIPKSVLQDAGYKGIQQQVLLGVDLNDMSTQTTVTIRGHRDGVDVKQRRFKADGKAFDMELAVPVATQATAGKLGLEDLGLEINDTPVPLVEGDNAYYDPTTGVLHLAYSPLGMSDVVVTVADKGAFEPERAYAMSTLDWTTMHMYNNGNTYFDQLDLDSLALGDLLVYNAHQKYYRTHTAIGTGDQGYSSDNMSSEDDDSPAFRIVQGRGDGWNVVPSYQTWKLVNDVRGEITFTASSPFGKTATNWRTGETVSLHAVNGDSTVIAMTCAHVSSPLGLDDSYLEGDYSMGMRILEKTSDSIVVGFVSYELGYQTGVGVYKYAVQSKGGINLTKTSANPDMTDGNDCYSLEGAEYALYSDEACTNKVLDFGKTDERGKTATGTVLTKGTYYIKEVTPPKGYALDEEVYEVEVQAGTNVDATLEDKPQNDPALMWIGKIDYDTTMEWPEGSASLAGAQFTVRYFDGYYTADTLPSDDEATRTWVVETNESGYANLDERFLVRGNNLYKTDEGNVTIPLGTITVIETKAPDGYFLDDGKGGSPQLFIMQVTSEDQAVTVETYNTPILKEKVWRGNITLQKNDAELGTNQAQGDATLSGAVYNIINASEHPVMSPQYNREVNPGDVVCTITTNSSGFASTTASDINGWEIPDEWDGKALAKGSYTVKEASPSKGYKLNTTWTGSATIVNDGDTISAGTTTEDVIHGGVAAGKVDRDNGSYEAEGAATLEGAKITITSLNEYPVIVGGQVYRNREVVAEMTIAEDSSHRYTCSVPADTLPYGTYVLRESKTSNEGYLYDEESQDWSITFSVTSDGTVYDFTDESYAVSNQVYRSDLSFTKVANPSMRRMANVAFEIESMTTGEKHIVVTDPNGEVNTSASNYGHTNKTNANDAAVDSDGKVDESKLDYTAGVWFHGSTNVDARVNDEVGALPYDTYHITELASDSTIGTEPVEFYVTVYRHDVVLEGGTVDDMEISIGTELLSSTGAHISIENYDDTLTDKVYLDNVKVGKKYKLVGELHEFDADGNDLGIVDSKTIDELKPIKSSFTQNITFNVSTADKAGYKFVAYEYLYDGNTVVAKHEDATDADQTVYVPSISTSLVNENGDKELTQTGTIKLIDTVEYDNVAVGYTYQISGTLHIVDEDGNDMGMLTDKHGERVTSYGTFVAESQHGTVDVVFEFEAGDLEGGTFVAYEALQFGAVTHATHADPLSEPQTVRVPTVTTDLIDENRQKVAPLSTKAHLEDHAAMTNLVVGREYRLEGELHFIDADGNDTGVVEGGTISKAFTAEDTAGEVVLDYFIDTTDFVGGHLVCIEKLSNADGVVLVEHTDLTNTRETVVVPKIATSAVDGTTGIQVGQASSAASIIDTVTYEGLPIGVETVLTGTAHLIGADGSDEGAIANAMGTVTFTPKEESGTIDVEIPINASALAGKKVVVFETLTYHGTTYAEHADATDEAQMVSYGQIATWAHSKQNDTHTLRNDKGVMVVDTVFYWGLEPGQTYNVEATLHARDASGKDLGEYAPETNKPINGYTAFTPEEESGFVDVQITFDTENLAGQMFTVYEELSHNGDVIATHTEIDDVDQFANVAGIKTTAADSETEDHTGAVADKVTINDEVVYSGLEAGETYVLKGKLMNYATKKEYQTADKKPVETEVEFKAEKSSGSVIVPFEFDGSNLDGVTVIAYEYLYDTEGNLLTSHEVIDSYDQSVTYHKPTAEEENTAEKAPKTGDFLGQYGWIIGIVAAIAAITMIVAIVMRRRQTAK